MSYSLEEHKHRYAAWAASRAASTKTCRFNVLQGKKIIEAVGLNTLVERPDDLPIPEQFDQQHREWREMAVNAAKERDLTRFGHGIAAKLINVYLKGIFVCGGYATHQKVAILHPPIDSLLLNELHEKKIGQSDQWNVARTQRWSKMTSEQYESVIATIRKAMSGAPLWQIEEHWRGYQ